MKVARALEAVRNVRLKQTRAMQGERKSEKSGKQLRRTAIRARNG